MPNRKPKKDKNIQELGMERINKLFEQAKSEFESHPERSHRYVALARKIAMRYNISDYIVKPHSPNVLFQKIETAIRYNKITRESALTKQGLNIDISISDESVIISFKKKLGSESVINEAKNTFNPFFLRSLKNKYCIIDFTSLTGFNIEDAKVLITIFQLFGDSELFVVVGEHYGSIVSYIDLDEIKFDDTVHFFISFGDMELFIRKMR